MDRKNVWIVAGAILLGMLLLSVSLAVAQRDFRTEPRPMDGPPAHYQVVNVTEGEIIIMDVTTGDLYSAKARDVKPYEARPRPAASKERSRIEFKDKEDFMRKDKAGMRPFRDPNFKDGSFKEKQEFFKKDDGPPVKDK